MPWQGNGWKPTSITRYIRSLRTSTGVAIVDTDCGEGFLKALSNPEGPHVLGCELVGSLLADWIGLPTLDFAIVDVSDEDEIPLATGGKAGIGPAFISRRVNGTSWGGDIDSLRLLDNIEDISRMILFDTWVRNCDRYRPEPRRRNLDNVFLMSTRKTDRDPLCPSEGSGLSGDAGSRPLRFHVRHYETGRSEVALTAIDHTHAFTCGRELSRRIAHIDAVQDELTYGEFPEFSEFRNLAVEAAVRKRLDEMDIVEAQRFVGMVPAAWVEDVEVKAAWASFIARRAGFLARPATAADDRNH